MTSQKIKYTGRRIITELLWAVFILVVIVATAWWAPSLFIPESKPVPDITTRGASTIPQPVLAQSETAVAQRVCDKVWKFIGDVEPPLTLTDCVEADRACVKRWGPHAVWAGVANSDGIPYCVCDQGYEMSPGDTSGMCTRQ